MVKRDRPGDGGVLLRATLRLDGTWSSYQGQDELLESIKTRLDAGLGFRGKTVSLKLIERRRRSGT